VSCIPAGSALRCPCSVCKECKEYARNGHLTGALKWFLSKAATLVEAVWNKQQLHYAIREPNAALCDHRAKGHTLLATPHNAPVN